MGYIFDAMNREARDRDQRERRHQPSLESGPTMPAADAVTAPLEGDPQSPAREVEPVNLSVRTGADSVDDLPGESDRGAPSLQNAATPTPVATTPAREPAESFAQVEAAEPVETPTSLRLADLMSNPPAAAHCPSGAPADWTESDRDEVAFVQTNLESIDDRLVALTERVSVIAEEYRGIRTSLLARWDHRRHLIHLITSATPQEGKTITSLNLGLSLAELHNRKTIVVECDLRLPQFTNLLSLPDSPGLVGYLEGAAELKQIIHSVGDSQLHVIPAGIRANDRAVQLLSSNKMTGLLDDLRRRYDHVIIDTPPVVDLADAGILGALSDDVLLIVRMHTTPRGLVEQAARTLASYSAPVTHMIATNQTHVGSSYYRSYYSRYGSHYTYRYRYNRYHDNAKAA